MTTLAQAIDQMYAAGMPPFKAGEPFVNTPKVKRYGPKGRAWYRLFEYRARDGRSYIFGAFGIWGTLEATKIETDWRGMDDAERDRLQRSQAELERRAREKNAERARFAAGRARSQWNASRSKPPDGVEHYLAHKGVECERGLRWLGDGTLLVPMVRYDVTEAREAEPDYVGPRRLVGLQKIAPDGGKRFNKGMVRRGAACRLGKAPRDRDLLLIAEGVATALSIRMATGREHAVFVAFDAGNLVEVARVLRTLYPASPMLFCADDDAYLAASMNRLLRENHGIAGPVPVPCTDLAVNGRHGPCLVCADWTRDAHGVEGIVCAVRTNERTLTFTRENAGRAYAHRAADEVGNAGVIFPVFRDRSVSPDPDADGKLTDFNDLQRVESIEAVREQLAGEIQRFAFSRDVASIVRAEIQRTKRARPDKKPPAGPPAAPGFDWDGFNARYTYVYPTDTVWDANLAELVKLQALRIHYGERLVEWWLRGERRRTVNLDQLVFEPGGAPPEGAINLFRGMPIKASSNGECDKLVALLHYLCGEDPEATNAPVTDWVLKWLAYPLQHPGAKMQTAIVMHGAEGTGKNLFFGAIREIYGEYGTLITQTELEDRFNGWLSRRLFIIANEVISRQELRHHVGRLKNMVTEPVLPIRDMWAPIRYESNHANLTFLTNELQALQIMPGDRRYMVIRTPGPLGEDYYAALGDELRGGGAARLYRYLLDYDCAGFGPHTKPILTAAKADLIEIGLTSVQFFQDQLHAGLLWPLAYVPCRSVDLYRAYTIFCSRTGERNPARLNRFSHEFMAMNGVSRGVYDVDEPFLSEAREKRRQAMCFVMGDVPDSVRRDDSAFRAWLKKNVAEFRGMLAEYAQQDDGRGSASGSGRKASNDD